MVKWETPYDRLTEKGESELGSWVGGLGLCLQGRYGAVFTTACIRHGGGRARWCTWASTWRGEQRGYMGSWVVGNCLASRVENLSPYQGLGESGIFLGCSVFFAIHDAIRAARQERGLPGPLRLNSPLTPEKIRMACEDKFTKMIPRDEPGSYVPWSVPIWIKYKPLVKMRGFFQQRNLSRLSALGW